MGDGTKMQKTLVTYKFPKSMGGDDVTIRELTPQEMVNVIDASDSAMTIADELVKKCLVKVGCVEVTGSNRDSVWHGFSPKQRELVNRAYRKLHIPDKDEDGDFFGSESVEVSG